MRHHKKALPCPPGQSQRSMTPRHRLVQCRHYTPLLVVNASPHTALTGGQCPPRIWWTRVCVQPISTIAWHVPPSHLTVMLYVPLRPKEGVGGPAKWNINLTRLWALPADVSWPPRTQHSCPPRTQHSCPSSSRWVEDGVCRGEKG